MDHGGWDSLPHIPPRAKLLAGHMAPHIVHSWNRKKVQCLGTLEGISILRFFLPLLSLSEMLVLESCRVSAPTPLVTG